MSSLHVDDVIGSVSTKALVPDAARALYVFAHGAGAGMEHAFLETMCARLGERGIATFRFQFPYMEAGRKRPDHKRRLMATVRAAIDAAHAGWPALPLIAGGKSMGGRMTSQLMAEDPHPAVRGLIFFGFPLHAAGKPATERGDHLAEVQAPMLFLQGTRDTLATLDLIEPVVSGLGARARLHIVDGGDHSFHVLKRSGRTDQEVHDELADACAAWVDAL